jgi:mRNA interferase MazF
MARGDIVAVELPAPSGRSGHEQVGSRPAVVVQTDITDARLPTTMVVPMTANLRAMRFPHTIRVDPSPQNGLSRPSVLLIFQLRAVDKRRLGSRGGSLEPHYLQDLEEEIGQLLQLSATPLDTGPGSPSQTQTT